MKLASIFDAPPRRTDSPDRRMERATGPLTDFLACAASIAFTLAVTIYIAYVVS